MQKWWTQLLTIVLLSLFFIALLLSLTDKSSVQELKPKFDEYIEKFNKSYHSPEEYDTRLHHFVASMREIERLNTESTGPDHLRAQYGLTKLSDMSPIEFKEIHLSDERLHKHPKMYGRGWNHGKDILDDSSEHKNHHRHSDVNNHHNNHIAFSRKKRAVLPLQVDWRTKGVIGPVRNQGLCGACWAFSTVGTMEAMSAIKTGVLETLSVQEAIDCAGLGNKGCSGGDICLLLDWLYITQTPVQKDKEYPLSLTNSACKAKSNATGVYVKTFTCDDFVGEEDSILQALALHGPVTVAVNALTWQNYLGGIIQYHCSGSPEDLNHAVELVGYDMTVEVPHYIVKNSWGKDFGIDGYLKLAFGSNICGLANEVATIDVK